MVRPHPGNEHPGGRRRKKTNNILLMICDQLSAGALSSWGNDDCRAPNIEGIVQQGVRFGSAYTACPLCQPARASFWTGRYPHQTGVLSNGRLHPVPQVRSSLPTLGSFFADAGYKAVHFGKRHDAGSLRGFELFPVGEKEVQPEHPAWPVHYDTRNDRNVREQAVDFLDGYSGNRPFLAVANLSNPHDICNWIGAFADETPPIDPPVDPPGLPPNLYRPAGEFEKLPLPIQYICCAHNRQAQIAQWDETKIRHYLCAYHHYLQRADRETGRILEALGKRNDAEKTLVVFMSDHGDSMCGRWMATKHTSFYDETTRIPLAFSGPGIQGGGRVINEPVSLIDLLPTLCDYAGIQTGDSVTGKSLLPWLKGEQKAAPHPYVVSQWHTEWGFTVEPGRMLRSDRFKYTGYLEENGEELYDLQSDPGEVRNLASDPAFARTLTEHRAMLREYVDATKDPFFNLKWKADPRWRSHKPGYRQHRGPAAPQYTEVREGS